MPRAPKLAVTVPKLSPHHHPAGCDCELAVPYIRVSKVGKRDYLISPDLQLASMEAYARMHNLRLVDPVTDIDKSGRTFTRRKVDSIIAEIKKGTYRRVLLWKWSRWARNVQESAVQLQRVRAVGGRVDSATEDFDQETASGRMNMDVMMRFDQYQSELIGETWKSVHDKRRDDGLPHGGRARFGYDYADRRYSINKAQADFLRSAYEGYVAGVSFGRLAQEFNDSGHLTTLGGKWTKQSVARMMDTGFAARLIRERSAPNGAPVNSLSSYDVWREGSHPAIISDELWLAYRGRREAQAKIPPRSRSAVHGLSALLFCTLCGCRLTTRYTGAYRSHQWQCLSQKTYHPGTSVTVSNKMALEIVRDWVTRVALEDPRRDERAKAGLTKAAAAPGADVERVQLQEQKARRERQLVKLIELFENDGIDLPTYRERKAEHEAEIRRLNDQLAVADEPKGRPNHEAFSRMVTEWDGLAADPAHLREALAALLSRVEVSPRSAESKWRCADDRVRPVGRWEAPDLEDWISEVRARSR